MCQKSVKLIFNNPLAGIGEKTFAELAFLFVMPEEEELGNGVVHWGYGASIAFDGPFAGRLRLAITSETMKHLSANMLGLELGEKLPEGVLLEDALTELLNVICGNLLPAIAGDKVVFKIESPEILSNPRLEESLEGHILAGYKKFNLDFGKAGLWLFVDEHAKIMQTAA